MLLIATPPATFTLHFLEIFYKTRTYLIHSAARGIHKRSICRPKNCDALNLSRDSQWEVSSSTFSQHLIWFQDLSPFSEQTPSQPPSSSTTILECRREWPGMRDNIRREVSWTQICDWTSVSAYLGNKTC